MSNRLDSTQDVVRMLENLKQQVYAPKRVPILGITFGYDADNLSMAIDKVRASLPKEVRDAAGIAREVDRILESARDEAASTLDTARAQADRMLEESRAEADRTREQARIQSEQLVADSEVLKIAQAQAEQIRSFAEKESLQLRRGAERYSHDVLAKLEASVARLLTEVERGRAALEPKPEVAATPDKAVAAVR